MRLIATAAVLAVLGGCSSPYDYALRTGAPVEPPPTSNGQRDFEAALPYEQSPWFDDDHLNLPDTSPVQTD